MHVCFAMMPNVAMVLVGSVDVLWRNGWTDFPLVSGVALG